MSSDCTNNLQNIDKLKWRNIIEYVIKGTQGPIHLCQICLNNSTDVVRVDGSVDFAKFCINIDGGSIAVKTILETVLPQIDFEEHSPQHICDVCLEKSVNAYILIKQYETSYIIMKKCVDSLFDSTTLLRNNGEKALEILCTMQSIQDLSRSHIDISGSSVSEKVVKIRHSTVNRTTLMYECTMCSQNYSNPREMKDHIKTRTLDTTHICREGGKMFKTNTDLRAHKKKHRIVQEKTQIICPECGKIFTSELNLKRHSVYHTESIITCDICKKKFKTESSLCTHILNNHETKTNAICDICGKVFTNIASIKSHMNCHRTRKCPYCDKTLKAHVSYDYHIKKHETGIGRKNVTRTIYKCNECNYKCCNKNTLEGHLNKMHLNIRPYICAYLKCEKRFFTKGNLQEHTKFVHMNVKTEKCPQCGVTLVSQKCLKRHMRLHTTERSFTCDLCDKTFISTSRRNEHIKRTHNSEQCCDFCEKKFSSRAVLKRHVRETHT